MEEGKQDQALEQDQVNTDNEKDQADQQDQNQTDIDSKIKAMEDRYKSEIAGLNKKVSSLNKDKEALELEKMSESERAEAERQKAIEESKAIKAETEALRKERDLTRVLFDLELDPELFGSRIKGDTPEEMKEDAVKLQEAINTAAEKRIEQEIARRLGGTKPPAGESKTELSPAEMVDRAAKISSGRRY